MACNTTGLLVKCTNGESRELRLVGAHVSGTRGSGGITASIGTTYNVFTNKDVGLDSLVVNHSFSATRR